MLWPLSAYTGYMSIQHRNISPGLLRAGDLVRLRGKGYKHTSRVRATAVEDEEGNVLVVSACPFGPNMSIYRLEWAGIKVDLLMEKR